MFFTQDDILFNTNKETHVDTNFVNFHNYNYFYKNNILYQDLGNYGTPLNRIYYEAPAQIGKTLGYNAFNDYAPDPANIKYYNTRSPFTNLHYIQGSRGQQDIEVELSRNINSRWNVGFDFKTATSLKQLGVSQRKEVQMQHYSFIAYTSYKSKSDRYKLLANFTVFQHTNNEFGGIKPDSGDTKADLFNYELENVNLNRPNTNGVIRSADKRYNFHLYQEYGIFNDSALKLFHIADYSIRSNSYEDDYLSTNRAYYAAHTDTTTSARPLFLADTNITQDLTKYKLLENKIGLKGEAGNLFYMAYFKRRDFSYEQFRYNDLNSTSSTYGENYIGGMVRYKITDLSSITGNAEYYLGRDYLVKGEYKNKLLTLGYYSVSSSPSLLQMQKTGNNFEWTNNFSNTVSNNLYLKANLRTGNFIFDPYVNFSNVQGYIYYDTTAMPVQSAASTQIYSAGFHTKIKWKSFYFENDLRYTTHSGADVIRMPELFNLARLYVYSPVFKKVLHLQFGVDFYWKSSYYANNYMPVTQQFYLNNSFLVDQYLLGDIYLNAFLKRAMFFLKVSHVNMDLPKAGYFITPYYTGMGRSIDFGIKWLFYD